MKTFHVDVFIGHRVVSSYFGRLDVSEDALTIRSRPAWMLTPRTAPRESVRRVTIRHRNFVKVIKIDDGGSVFANVNVNVRVGGFERLQDELQRCGFVLVDMN